MNTRILTNIVTSNIILFIIATTFIVCILPLMQRWLSEKDEKTYKFFIYVFFIIYLIATLYITILGRNVQKHHVMQIIPNWLDWSNPKETCHALVHENIPNIFLFYPFGYLLPCILVAVSNKWRSFDSTKMCLIVAINGLCFSLIIETTQYFTKRGFFDLGDIIHNLLGTICGFGLMWKMYWICEKKNKSNNKNNY